MGCCTECAVDAEPESETIAMHSEVFSSVNWRPIRYEAKTVSCKQRPSSIRNQSDMKHKRYRVNAVLSLLV